MTEKKSTTHQRVTIIFHDKDFLVDINAYAEFLSITKTEAIYNLAKKGFESLKEDLDKEGLGRLFRIKEMLVEIDKNKK